VRAISTLCLAICKNTPLTLIILSLRLEGYIDLTKPKSGASLLLLELVYFLSNYQLKKKTERKESERIKRETFLPHVFKPQLPEC